MKRYEEDSIGMSPHPEGEWVSYEEADKIIRIRKSELALERERNEILLRKLVGIHELLYPAPIINNGIVWKFNPPNAHEILQELSDRIGSASS